MLKISDKLMFILLTCLLLATSACNTSHEIKIYVSPQGEDNPEGTRENPCRNLHYVQQMVRQELKHNPDASIIIYLEDGEYYLEEPLIFTGQDSPSPVGNVTWEAINEGKAIIIGARRLADWKKLNEPNMEIPSGIRDMIYYADLPEINGRMINPKVMFSEGMNVRRARGKGFVPDAGTFQYMAEFKNNNGLLDTLHYPAGSIKKWINLNDVELVIRPNFGWVMNILPLKKVDTEKQIAVTGIPATYPMRPLMFQNAFSYGSESCWMENIFEAMKQPGDWVSDSEAGKIYMVTDGKPPSFPVFVPVLEELIRLEGTDLSPLRNLVFRGLEFRYTERDTWTREDIGLQHDWEFYDKSNAVFRMKGAENCMIDGCRFRDCGNTAIRLDFYAQRNRVINNEIFNMGGTGVLLCGYGPGYSDLNKNNEVANNHIHHCGQQYWMCAAIHIWQSGSNRIAHNKIHDMPYIGMVLSGMRPPFFLYDRHLRELYGTVNRESVSDGVKKILAMTEGNAGIEGISEVAVGDQIPQYRAMDIMDEFIYTDNNLIEYNEIHDVMQVMADGDAIYLSATGRGNIIRGNYIHDVVTYGSIGHMIRNDGPQFWTLIEDNIIMNSSGGITLKDGIHARNNYIINIKYPPDASEMARRIYCPFQINSMDTLSPYIIRGNVVYFEETAMDKFYNPHSSETGFMWKILENSDYNLYWSAADPQSAEKLLETSRKDHHLEMNSMVADPGFRDPARGDFTIDKSSPLYALGIKPLDPAKSGLLPERLK